jgi:hypothetical protein
MKGMPGEHPTGQVAPAEVFDLPPGSAAPGAARRSVNEFSRDLGALHQDVRLLVSELLTAGVEAMPQAGGLRLRISIGPRVVRVELSHGERVARDMWGEVSGPGQLGRMLMDSLTTRWGKAPPDGALLWFEIERS